MWKSRSKVAPFSNERHFEIWFPKKKTITFFWSKLSKLHKKDPILHVTTTFSLKQGDTRTNSVPIPHPLRLWTVAYSEDVRGPWTTDFPGPLPLPCLFLIFFFSFFSLSLGASFSSGAPGHCPPMPPTRYATGFEARFVIWGESRPTVLHPGGSVDQYSTTRSRALSVSCKWPGEEWNRGLRRPRIPVPYFSVSCSHPPPPSTIIRSNYFWNSLYKYQQEKQVKSL